jgi:transketolase
MAISNALSYDDLPRLMTLQTGDEKHSSAATSTLDVLWVLYDRVLGPDDRFLLSKGHGPVSLYAVLAAKGHIPVDVLPTFGAYDSPLGNHPDRVLVPGVELSSGSLGHGLPVAVGRALAGAPGRGARVFCLVGDGELDEGSNWEAVQYAGRAGLGNLTAVVVDNHSATYNWPGGIEHRFGLEGWTTDRVDGRNHDALERALNNRSAQPHCVVAEIVG